MICDICKKGEAIYECLGCGRKICLNCGDSCGVVVDRDAESEKGES
jgi:hypothetical protein